MGQQQFLMIFLSIVILGIAIAAGVELFGANRTTANRDAIIHDMNEIAVDAIRYKAKPRFMGGGGGSFVGFLIPEKLQKDGNAAYSCTSADSSITLVAVSAIDSSSTVTGTISSDGTLVKSDLVYTGQFE